MMKSNSLRKKLFVFIAVAVFCNIHTSRVHAQSITFSDDQLRLLDVRYKNYRLGNGVEGYLYNDRLYLALIDVVALLELPIDVTAQSAKGTISQGKLGNLDLLFTENRWKLSIGDEERTVAVGDVVMNDGYIFVAEDVLEVWLPIEVSLKLADSYIILETRQTLPFEQSLARQAQIINPKDYLSKSEYPIWDTPYSLWDMPSTEIRVSHSTFKNIKRDDVETRRSTRYTLQSNGDLALMSTNLFITGDRDNGIRSASVRLDRYSSENDIFGPLKLSRFSFGDVSVPGVDNSFGRGFVVSNEPSAGQFVRDITSIEGNHYPGWEVELYLGRTVIDFQVIGEDGKYRFDDIILTQGVNDYRLVFYGPAGEQEEQSRTLYQGNDSKEIGKIRYSFGINQPDTRVYEPGEEGGSSTWQANWIGRVSVAENWSFSAGYTRRWLDEGDLSDTRIVAEDDIDDLYQVGSSVFWGGHSISISARQENDNPFSLFYSLGGDFLNLDYRLNYQDFRIEDDPSGNRLHESYGLSLTTNLGPIATV